jgi:hypothetical protein
MYKNQQPNDRKKMLPSLMRARIVGEVPTFYIILSDANGRRQVSLGTDLAAALEQRKKLLLPERAQWPSPIKLEWVIDLYRKIQLPLTKEERYEMDKRELVNIKSFFSKQSIALDALSPRLIEDYLDSLGPRQKLRGGAALALFSHIHKFSTSVGWTTMEDPTPHVRGFGQAGREIYLIEEALRRLAVHSNREMLDALQFVLLSGEPAGVAFKMQRDQVKMNTLYFSDANGAIKGILLFDARGQDTEFGALVRVLLRARRTAWVSPALLIPAESGYGLSAADFIKYFDGLKQAVIQDLMQDKRRDLVNIVNAVELDMLHNLRQPDRERLARCVWESWSASRP